MVADKIRIKKSQKPKVEQWCKALSVIFQEFIPVPYQPTSAPIETDDLEEFDGGIEL